MRCLFKINKNDIKKVKLSNNNKGQYKKAYITMKQYKDLP